MRGSRGRDAIVRLLGRGGDRGQRYAPSRRCAYPRGNRGERALQLRGDARIAEFRVTLRSLLEVLAGDALQLSSQRAGEDSERLLRLGIGLEPFFIPVSGPVWRAAGWVLAR